MSSHLVKYLVCYDICNPKRLRRVHRTIRDYGIPLQYSVFELELNEIKLKQLIRDLTIIIEPSEDKVMFYRLTPQQKPICLGITVQTDDLLFV